MQTALASPRADGRPHFSISPHPYPSTAEAPPYSPLPSAVSSQACFSQVQFPIRETPFLID